MIVPGPMRERVVLQRPTTARTGPGSSSIEWEDVAEVWAAIRGLSSRELLQAMQANSIATYELRIRFYSGIDGTWRAVWKDAKTGRDRPLEFFGDPLERENRAVHVILCREAT